MYLANIRGVMKLVRKKPQFVSVATTNLIHQLLHKIQGNRLNGRSHPPEVINAFITDTCNLGCRECHYAHSDKPGFSLNQVGHMQPYIFQKFMDEIPGRPVVSFTGGEPLLHPQVIELISYAKQKGRVCTLVTNGWCLESKAQELCEVGLDLLSVSVDGPKATHDSIRGNNSFERLAVGLEKILSSPNRPIVFISLAISDMNYDKLIPTYGLARNWGVDGLNFNHLWMQTDQMVKNLKANSPLFSGDHVDWEVNNEDIDVEFLADCLEIIRDARRGGEMIVMESPYLNRQEISDWYRKPENPMKHTTVRCGWIRMKLWADGKIKPCRDWEVGNICEDNAEEIWNGKEYQEFRKILKDEGMLPICTRCCFMAHR
jgi:MoaA/NifB/PqqE/SkfB family radical SAM enzyme